MAKDEGKNDKKSQPGDKGPSNDLYSAITFFIKSVKWSEAQSRVEGWLEELTEMERHLVELKFKSINPVNGVTIIGSIVEQDAAPDRHSMAKRYGLFSSVVINRSFENVFLNFEKAHPDGSEVIEDFIVSLSGEEADYFRFSLTQNMANAQDILWSLSQKKDNDQMKKSAKARNLLP